MTTKRLLDVIASSAGLLLLVPLLVAVALAVRFSSPGSVIFRQERIGRHGRPFKILKFRTMKVDAEQAGPQVTVGSDPRITAVGRLLRDTKLDELPQLWNVLLGDMSLVGPRPEVPRYVAHYPPDVAREVLSVRPGITEALSIELRNEAKLLAAAPNPERFYIDKLLPKKLEAQLHYVRTRSLVGDLRIIIRTIMTLLAK